MNKQCVGYAMASYFGGRSEVRVRLQAVSVAVVDYTSMYPTIFILQDLQSLIVAKRIKPRIATSDTQALLEEITLEMLYDPAIWPMLNRIALIEPTDDVLPVRMRLAEDEPLRIASAYFTSSSPRWYTVADLIGAKLLGRRVPQITKAIEFVPNGENPDLRPIDFLGTTLDPTQSIMKTVIEERYRARKAGALDPEASRRELALKVLVNSLGYGIFAEINVTAQERPSKRSVVQRLKRGSQGVWYSDIGPMDGEVPDERPGRFFSPVIATLVTGGARLMLAMAEAEVVRRGGTFAFCDTDSLAIVAGKTGPEGIPRLSEADVQQIIAAFDRLNPYDPDIIPHLLKREYADVDGLQCLAVSAKRYVLFTVGKRRRLSIVKASESGIGSMLGRTANETVSRLARRVWRKILIDELGFKYRGPQKRRIDRLTQFDESMRHKLPISQPHIWDTKAFRAFNRTKTYDFQVKPFNFLQAVTPAIEIGKGVRPIAPFERDAVKSRKLKWYDFESGDIVDLDWNQTARAGSAGVATMDEFIEPYARNPESKAAGPDGRPAGPETRGILGRLHLRDGPPVRIGKEVDRLNEDEDYRLDATDPDGFRLKRDEQLITALAKLGGKATPELAALPRVSERRLRDVLKGRAVPRENLRNRIVDLARTWWVSRLGMA
jgi:hypothetical protein